MDKAEAVAKLAETAKTAIPVVAKDALAAALIIVAFFAFIVIGLAGFVIWIQRGQLRDFNHHLSRQVDANIAQAKTLEGQSTHIAHIPRMSELLAAILSFWESQGFRFRNPAPPPHKEG